MNPRSIAVAVVAAIGAASAAAQSSVSISGLIDVAVLRDFDKTRQVGPIAPNNFAIAGSEDLGGGLAAIFRLSHRFDPSTGQAEGAGFKPFWHGESTVGLQGPFGTVRLGRRMDAVWANDWAFDPWGNFDRIASPAWQFWHFNYATDRASNNGNPEFGRVNNSIFYDSPVFGGLTLHLDAAAERTEASGAKGRHRAVSLNYDQGPVSAMLAGGRNGSGDTVLFVAGRYQLGSLALMGAYDRSRFKATDASSTARAYTLGVTYAIGAATLKAGYGRLDTGATANAVTTMLGLGAQYHLSKRTNLYASAGQLRPQGTGSRTAYGVGVNHAF